MKTFKCTKEYIILCFYLAIVIKWNHTEPVFWFAALLWGLLIIIYEKSVRRYVEKEFESEDK